ncbi:DUF5694 domain-containing protein [Kangiella sp. HZ709]|uniref:DUF5694 domain-containing protein n=1 Tax=Kangiella sp. HZ709 TaxID=2666328 RepID=UPI0012B0BD64|nr:DUF5694 domain-containing protein [Kangiella sp. HZ709]MRX26594.1 hypothetical protein [Kangiella sp. HZ709]
MFKNLVISLVALYSFTSSSISYADKSESVKSDQPIQVMIIGTEHFANPGQDLINKKVDSVLTPKKQQELQDISNSLMRFKPTLVAVEEQALEPAYVSKDYYQFTKADLLKEPNETVQVGYRLAKMANLKHVYGIDEQPSDGEPDYFPADKFFKHLADTKQQEAFNLAFANIKNELDGFFAKHKKEHLGNYLAQLNSKGSPVISLSFYLEMLKYDQGEKQPGAEVFAYYMMRNTKIASKLLDVAKPGDRVVVVYGAGHKAWLDFIFNNMQGVELVDPVPYLAIQ